MVVKFIPILFLTAEGIFASTPWEESDTDLVLDCLYLKQGLKSVWMGGSFSKVESLLILRDRPKADSRPGNIPWMEGTDTKSMIFEVEGPPIPDREVWIHGQCEGDDLTCEIGSLDAGPGVAGKEFLASLTFASSRRGITLFLRLRGDAEDTGTVPRRVPLTAEFLVHTLTSRIRARPGQDVLLHCAHLGLEAPEEAITEWVSRHQGSGRRLGRGMGAADGGERRGEFSLQLDGVSVGDEGTYVCSVRSQRGEAQQTCLLQVVEPPQVRIMHETLRSPGTLSCEASGFYPPEVDITWEIEVEGEGALPLPVIYTSYVKNRDGTFNVSAETSLQTSQDGDPSPLYTCRVTHEGFQTPESVGYRLPLRIGAAENISGWIFQAVLGITLFLLPLCWIRRKRGDCPVERTTALNGPPEDRGRTSPAVDTPLQRVELGRRDQSVSCYSAEILDTAEMDEGPR